jgi:hypothetical protein
MRWTECASVSCHGTKPLAREKAARDWRLGSGVVTTLIEQRSRSGCSVLRIEGGKHSNPQDRSPNEQDAHQPAAPAHARRHERRFASDTQAIVANDPRGFERIGVALELGSDPALHLQNGEAWPGQVLIWLKRMAGRAHAEIAMPVESIALDARRRGFP